jgi:hypothetical protein
MAIQTDGNAPYGPPTAVLGLISGYRERGLQTPFTIDVLTKAGVSEALAPRTMQSLKLLDLLDKDGQPTDVLEALRKAPSDEFPARLEAVIKAAYAEVFTYIDPAQDPPERVRDAFRSYKPQGQQERMVTLFLGLCEAAGIVSQRPKRTKRARPASAKSSLPRIPTSDRAQHKTDPILDPLVAHTGFTPQQAPGGHPIIQGLIRELPPINAKWPRSKYERWLTLQAAAFDLLYEIEDED